MPGLFRTSSGNECVWCKKAIHCLSSPTVSPSPHRACVTVTQILCGLDPFRAGPRISYTYTFSKFTKKTQQINLPVVTNLSTGLTEPGSDKGFVVRFLHASRTTEEIPSDKPRAHVK